jgi:hypothetical protein
MRLLVHAVLAMALLFSVAPISGAATLDFTGAVGAAIAAGSADTAVYSGNAAFGDVTFTANPKGSDLTQIAGSGLGINCIGSGLYCAVDKASQIDNGEILKISFEQPLLVTSVDIRNLQGTDIALGWLSIHIDEGGAVVGSDFAIDFDSDDASASGALTLAINRWASSISFVPDQGFFNAFSVAAISIGGVTPGPIVPSPANPIPEPSSVLLMLIGAGIIAAQVRKRI